MPQSATTTSWYCWSYQSAEGNYTNLDAADDTTYFFGDYNEECSEWNAPVKEMPQDSYWVYDERTPSLVENDPEFPTFKHSFLPTSWQPWVWFLKNPTSATPATCAPLHAGKTYPMTIRHQMAGADHYEVVQAGDCYCVELVSQFERGTEALVEATFAWGKLSDEGDYAKLTTTPTAPAGGDNGVTGTYDGNPTVTWDTAGANKVLEGVWRVDMHLEQEFKSAIASGGSTQTVNLYRYKPIEVVMHGIFEIRDSWDDYVDREPRTVTIKIWKHDRTHYVLFTLTNCVPINWKKTGKAYKGFYNSVCACEAEQLNITSNWLAEYDGADGDFANHFKGLVS